MAIKLTRKELHEAGKMNKRGFALTTEEAAEKTAEAAERNALKREIAKDGGKGLGFLEKVYFNLGKSKIFNFARNHKITTFVLASGAALGGAMIFRHGKGDVPDQAELTPTAAAISSPDQLASGPVDGMAANQWQQTVASSRGTGAPAR